MPKTEEIFAAADRQGLSLAEYLKHNYSEDKLANLERNIKTQLNSLSAEISGYMGGLDDLSKIERNLLSLGESKLDIMQSRLRQSLHAKQVEFEEMLSSENIAIPESGVEALCVPQADLLAVE